MTYNDINMSHNKESINCQIIEVEYKGIITKHFIHGQSRNLAISKLIRTGWFLNTSRRIIY